MLVDRELYQVRFLFHPVVQDRCRRVRLNRYSYHMMYSFYCVFRVKGNVVLCVCSGFHHYGSAAAFSPTSPMRSSLMPGHSAPFLPGTSPPVSLSHIPAHAAAHTPHGTGLPHFVHASYNTVSCTINHSFSIL